MYKNSLLFQNLSHEDIDDILKTLNSTVKNYKKNTTLFHTGDRIHSIGYVLSGSLSIQSIDIWGNTSILSVIEENQYFGETYALLDKQPLQVDVVANTNTSVLFIDVSDIPHDKSWSYLLLKNILDISLKKNLTLSTRSFHTSPKTIRERVMSYLNTMYINKKSTAFYIPFNRQQLADYLNVERTALSKELSKMKKEGLINYHKNYFELK